MERLVKIGRGVCDGCGARNVNCFPVDCAPAVGLALCEKCMGLELDEEQRASIDRMMDACDAVEVEVALNAAQQAKVEME